MEINELEVLPEQVEQDTASDIYSVLEHDIESIKNAFNKTNELIARLGIIRVEYLKLESDLQIQVNNSVSTTNVLANLARENSGAPEEYLLNPKTMKFEPPKQQ